MTDGCWCSTNAFPNFNGTFNFYLGSFFTPPSQKNQEFLNGMTYVVLHKKVSQFHEYFLNLGSMHEKGGKSKSYAFHLKKIARYTFKIMMDHS